MSRIAQKFDRLKAAGRKGFIPFVTAGDPSLELSESIVLTLANSGADIIELGVPFSDPVADGPTIQRSSQRALRAGTHLSDVLSLARRLSKQSDVPLVLFSYLNPLLAYGVERLAADARTSGIEGVLITDVVDREADEYRRILAEFHIDLISLIAPTTSEARLKSICENAVGFLYAVSRAGITGARVDRSSTAEDLVRRARRYTDLPIAVGFGISTAEQIDDVWRFADAAVVGSAIVAQSERHMSDSEVVHSVEDFVTRLLPSVAKTVLET